METLRGVEIVDVDWHSPMHILGVASFTYLTTSFLESSVQKLINEEPEKAVLTAGAGLLFFLYRYGNAPVTQRYFYGKIEEELEARELRQHGKY